jgi:hypothetical protein
MYFVVNAIKIPYTKHTLILLHLQYKIMIKRSCKVKYAFYVLGILMLTLDIVFTIRSDLGTSPFDALLVGESINLGPTVGSWKQ